MQQTFGHYRVLEQIGSGGMGVVYRARDERLQRDVAVKVLPSDRLRDAEARKRFKREALALSRLNHPNIATIHDFVAFDGVDVLVMEHIEGQSIDEMLERGPLAEREAVRLGQQLAAALETAHERGVIHRDLKPGNLRVTPDGRLKVLDFGLARALQLESEGTTESVTGPAFAGTLPYMAPEQLTGAPLDARTDLYAAGAVLYEMVTGARVHGDLTGPRLLGAILDDAAPSARAANPRVSVAFDQVLAKALDKNPELRYQSARELAVDLERLATTVTDRAARRPRPAPAPRRLAIAVLASLVVLLTGWIVYDRSGHDTPVRSRGSIAIADFENTTGDEGLADAIRAGLTVQLQQSEYGNVLSREQIFDALRRMQRAERRLDADTGRELCVRENVAVLVAGTIQRLGDVTRVDARAVDAAAGDVMFAANVQFRTENEAFAAIDELSRKVRRYLGESAAGIEQRSEPLAKVTTRSLEALKQYSRAADEFARGDSDAALPLLRAALDVDPDFAMAHRLIARVYETLGNGAKELEHLSRAYDLRASLTERERRHVEASYLRGAGEYERAVETLTALTTLYPGDAEARYELAVGLRDAGNMRKAVQELETIIAEAPYVTVAYGELTLLLTRLSEYQRAREVHEQATRRQIRSPRLAWGLGMLLLGEGRGAEARRVFVDLESHGDVFASIARLYQSTVDIYEGRLVAAAERLERDILLDRKGRNTLAELKRREILARIAILRGQRDVARQQALLMLESYPDRLGPEELRRAAILLSRLGEIPRARALVAQLAREGERIGSAFARSCHQNAAAELAVAENQIPRAIDLLKQAAAEYWRPAISQGLARAYAATQDWPRARAEWTSYLAARGAIMQDGFAADWVTAHLELARVERNAGDLAAARRHYETFLNLWREARDLAIVRMADEEFRELVAASAARSGVAATTGR